MGSIIIGKNIVKTYEADELFYALDDISITINEGELLIIVGASGSGKSTLLNILSGIDRCSSGEVYYKNENITNYSEKELTKYRRNNIGFIYQAFNLINELTIYENLLLMNNSKNEVDKILKKVGLFDKKNQYPKQLSGGEQQKVSIARALSKNCDVIFCDEPTGSLDSKNSKKILLLLEKLCREENKTIVIVTHNNDIVKMADRVYTMKNGKITNEKINKNPLSVKDIDL